MKKVIDKSDSRGHSLYDWLDSHHTFSFDEYYNPRRMNFGALRVLNDDRVAPGKGFGTHPHKNMEIISIPLKGKLKHGDNHQNSRVITPGDIQTMSAGTGIYHSEMNGSDTEAVEFLQIISGLWMLIQGRILNHKVVKCYRTKKVKVLRAQSASVDLDGRILPKHFPLEVGVLPEKTTLIIPN